MSTRRLLIATAIALGACGSLHAADFPVNYAVPDARLDTIRGGFDLGSQLQASLGLERTVMINGVEAIRQSVNIPDVAKITVDQANALRAIMGTTFVTNGVAGVTSSAISTGSQSLSTAAAQASVPTTAIASTTQAISVPTNLAGMTTPVGGSSPSLVVQNALDNQAITATTKIDASVNTSQMLQNLRIDESIRDATIQFRGN
ncbi:hypothetical protein L2Y96_05900 [Luteibacter aegosomaticola]|uniref:hypothetical protein n=1 Tax=Luteibacter aegosomaticola TaxID=2911538 RepID=UPI001FF74DF5|nr:hypothetical protein [Luteibacter aegosomaticola]UPG91303.1 hypothetical protein L2Y96_05900 [Luteibacter aegosomaticola]